jgi:hypothetical protein
MTKKSKTLVGKKVNVQTYLDPKTYEELKKFARPYEARWEASLLRQVIYEWLEMKAKQKTK